MFPHQASEIDTKLHHIHPDWLVLTEKLKFNEVNNRNPLIKRNFYLHIPIIEKYNDIFAQQNKIQIQTTKPLNH